MIGRMHRELTGGDLCEVLVDVSAHRHHGHNSDIKVRPTVGITHFVSRPREGHPAVSKVGPLCQLPAFRYPPEQIWEPLGTASRVFDSTSAATNCLSEEVSLYPSQSDSEVQTPLPSVHYNSAFDLSRWAAGHSLQSDENSVSPGASLWITHTGEAYGSEFSIRADGLPGPTPVELKGEIPQEDADHILYPQPRVHSGGLVSSGHPGHSTVSKVQPSNDGAATPDPLSSFVFPRLELGAERRGSLQRLEKKRSASNLVAYWESVNKGWDRMSSLADEKDADTHHDGVPQTEAYQSASHDFQWSTSWLRNIIALPGTTHKSILTELPRRKSSQPKPNSAMPRSLTGGCSPATLVDMKFKGTVNNREHLLNEAAVLANEVADHEDQQCADHLELTEVNHFHASRSPPSVHESLPSEIESSADEGELGHRSHTIRGPKHYRSTPGMHSRNVVVNIPKRTSSLLKAKLGSRSWLGGSHRNRSREQRNSNVSPSHRPTIDRTVLAHREEDEKDSDSYSPKRSGCFTGGKIARRIKSCRLPRIQSRPSFHRDNVDGASPTDDDQLEIDAPEAARLKPATWNYDGASDEDDWITGSDARQGANAGQTSSERRSQRPHSAPPGSQEISSEPEPDGKFQTHGSTRISLRGRSHVSIRGYQGVNLARAYRRQPIARDWSAVRKRFVATVACLSTAAIGILIGIYAGLVPSIQYWIADLEHYAILGNVFFYLGLAIPSFFFWPLPLLHGRKPYILSSLVLSMPLLFPQAISVSEMRSPYVNTWR